jgi:hypothetical protein
MSASVGREVRMRRWLIPAALLSVLAALAVGGLLGFPWSG